MSEAIIMLLTSCFFARLGVKWLLAVGVGAWALRCALFAIAPIGAQVADNVCDRFLGDALALTCSRTAGA